MTTLHSVPAENRPPVPFDELTLRVALEGVDNQIRENAEVVCQKVAANIDVAEARVLAEKTLELLRARRLLVVAHAEAMAGID